MTTTTSPPPELADQQVAAAPEPEPRRHWAVTPVLIAWGALIVLAYVWGRHLAETTNIGIGVPPLHSGLRTRVNWATPGALVLGGAGVAVLPWLARRLPWRAVPAVIAASAALWSVVLASNDGIDGLIGGVGRRGDYLTISERITSPHVFLQHFVATLRAGEFPTHTSGHPPGFVLVLWFTHQLGFRGSGWATALCIGGGAIALALVAVTVRDVAGEPAARSAMPFLVLSPAAIWIATTPDAFFAGVGAAAVCAIVLATSPARGRAQALSFAVLGGVLFGAVILLSYGLLLLAVIPAAVAWSRRSFRPLLAAAAGTVAVILAFALAGFWWVDGLLASRARYWAGIASTRPLRYFVIANLAALALVCGPATAAAFTRLRPHGVRILVGGACAAVVFADVSGLSKGEVERIWLPFAIWLLPACGMLATRPRLARTLLTMQLITALALQTFLHNA